MPRNKLQTISRRDMLSIARELAAEYGESLTLTAFRRETGFSQWLIFDLFGNWKNLRTELGLTPEAPRARNKLTLEQLQKTLREVIAEQGENISELKFCKLTGISGSTIARKAGSWGELRMSLGLVPRARIPQRYSDQDLILDLFRVYRVLKRCPRMTEHKRFGGRIPAMTIRDRFGSWKNVRVVFEHHRRKLTQQLRQSQ